MSNHMAPSSKDIDTVIPGLENVVGNYTAKMEFLRRRGLSHANQESNCLIHGTPGTGKTSLIIDHIRALKKDPTIGFEEDAGMTAKVIGCEYSFFRIDGGTMPKERVEQLAYWSPWCGNHMLLLVDELGELFNRGLEQCLRPALEQPNVTVYATAQDFRAQFRGTLTGFTKNRLQALLRRFPCRIPTERPTDEELIQWISDRIRKWGISSSPAAIRKLAVKSGGVVGFAMNALSAAAASADRRLSVELVLKMDVDPLFI